MKLITCSFTGEMPIYFMYVCVRSCSVMFNSLQSHGLSPARLLCPWNFPGKNTGGGCHFLLQGIFPTQGMKLCLLVFPVLAGRFFTTVPIPGKMLCIHIIFSRSHLIVGFAWTILFHQFHRPSLHLQRGMTCPYLHWSHTQEGDWGKKLKLQSMLIS